MEKYSLLELTILEEKLSKRIPPCPKWDIHSSRRGEYKADHDVLVEEWQEEWKKELGALHRVGAEIEKRLTEFINQSDKA